MSVAHKKRLNRIKAEEERLAAIKEEKRLAANKRRRERAHEKKTLAMAVKAAESEADFDKLVQAEKKRIAKEEGIKSGGGYSNHSRTSTAIRSARENLTKAFDLMGGVPALVVWGRQNPTEFYRIWARLIPRESVELSAQLPLESLLEKLSGHGNEGMSVSDAAWQVGADLLEKGRKKAAEEDLAAARPEDIN